MELIQITSREEAIKEVPPLLAGGFRPFFLLAGAYGALFPIAWLAIFFDAAPSPAAFRSVVFHGHEMVFGFAAAAVSGFLLTATATWSRIPPVTGWRLGMIAGAWAAGRAAMWASGALSPLVVAVLDLALVPALAAGVMPVLLSPGNRQNLILLPVLALFFLANLMFHLEPLAGIAGAASAGLRIGVNLLMLLVVIFIGRIVPTFLGIARLGAGGPRRPVSWPLLEGLAIGSVALFLAADLVDHEAAWVGLLALGAAGAQVVRMANWRAGGLLRKPFLLGLHLGYAWVAAGLALTGSAYLGGLIPGASALHAMTAGGIGGTIFAVMSIVGLLHTGRPAEIRPLVAAACLLVSAAALVRIAAPVLFGEGYKEALIASVVLWAAAFGIHVVVYWPILSKRRPDGIPG